jgi:hypothetical protein
LADSYQKTAAWNVRWTRLQNVVDASAPPPLVFFLVGVYVGIKLFMLLLFVPALQTRSWVRGIRRWVTSTLLPLLTSSSLSAAPKFMGSWHGGSGARWNAHWLRTLLLGWERYTHIEIPSGACCADVFNCYGLFVLPHRCFWLGRW